MRHNVDDRHTIMIDLLMDYDVDDNWKMLHGDNVQHSYKKEVNPSHLPCCGQMDFSLTIFSFIVPLWP
jgi:hypothetical protein